jgi:molybdopterin-guanine dinucleotide biosynthesis protein A
MSGESARSSGELPAASARRSRAAESQASITGILLVGGASRRFGSPKALASLGITTLAERGWRSLRWCDERIAVGKADTPPLPFEVRDDGIDVRAPIAGVVAGLRYARNEVCVFLPVDAPLVGEDELRALVAGCRDAAVPQTGPLPGAYRRCALSVLERRLAGGELALRDALAELDTAVVELPLERLANVNTVAELQRLASRPGA